jgi:DNA-binding transcriptional MerR regulator
MFRIGEFSKLTQVSIRMLRYYDEAGLLKPQEIGHGTVCIQLNKYPFLTE